MAIRAELIEFRLSTLEMEQGHYLDLLSLISLIDDANRPKLLNMFHDSSERIAAARGSSNNHQAWVGGYLHHVTETMNIACQLYKALNSVRKLPFSLSEALEVMFLHDIEKPWKYSDLCRCGHHRSSHNQINSASDASCGPCFQLGTQCDMYRMPELKTKESRRKFRDEMIRQYKVLLSADQENALKYVEGVPDSEYTPGERTMGELAAFCHSCDILSARLWHDKGKDVPAPHWE